MAVAGAAKISTCATHTVRRESAAHPRRGARRGECAGCGSDLDREAHRDEGEGDAGDGREHRRTRDQRAQALDEGDALWSTGMLGPVFNM